MYVNKDTELEFLYFQLIQLFLHENNNALYKNTNTTDNSWL